MTFTVLRLAVPEHSSDEIVGALSEDSCGARCDSREDGTVDVELFFTSREAARAALARAGRLLDRLGLAGQVAAPVLASFRDEPWVERFQAALEPFDLGRTFRVFPGKAAVVESGGRIAIRLTPGRAFGTGEHPTTSLCVELLERRVRPGSSWLDLGCGTAILGLAAAHLGAADVLALDHDPEAAAVARRVVARNRAGGARVRVACGSLGAVARRRFDGIVANIELPFFLEHARALARHVERGGCLIVSGFLEQDAEPLSDVLREAGLEPAPPRVRAEWAALVADRREN